jgi:hypothetical protein
LDFSTDDTILVTERDGSGWWKGKNNKTGAEGLFPRYNIFNKATWFV